MTRAECKDWIEKNLTELIQSCSLVRDELTITVLPEHLHRLCLHLRDEIMLSFKILVDLTCVDYLHYGISEWATDEATTTGFSRAVEPQKNQTALQPPARYAVVYHLLSLTHNLRVRMKVWVSGDYPMVTTVTDIWPSANWYEREVFDLFGVLFDGHPDLRRLLTDYGFVGHPFRKDFPLSGRVEVRYDHAQKRVVYEPVDIVPRTLVPKVIREAGEPHV